jgi:AbrB family looped-hinge helix DNA binding protein
MEALGSPPKAQIVLPKVVRDVYHWAPGTEFSVEDTGGGILLRPIKTSQPTRLDDVVGCLLVEGFPRSIEEMDDAIGAELRDRRDRGRYSRHRPSADGRSATADRPGSHVV